MVIPTRAPNPPYDGPAGGGEGWQAELRLGFERRIDRTVLASRSRRGPLTVQRAFHPEGETAHVYLLHPPGGVVGGDQLRIDAACAAGARALLTTPAAGKFYRSGGATARQGVHLRGAEGAAVEWLPQETIVFDGARLESALHIDLNAGARFIGWDVVCFGRPACGEAFSSGAGQFRLRLQQDGVPLLQERFLADSRFVRANWGLRGHPVLATLLACPVAPELLSAVREILGDRPDVGATRLGEVLVVRALGWRAEDMRRLFAEIWAAVRPAVIGRVACIPRIWAT
ncbi:MAG: urease accessory protein UreD [Methylococcaceae bacterium]|nr:urease accessory protein UreD [Methylococcaceae bacterium]